MMITVLGSNVFDIILSYTIMCLFLNRDVFLFHRVPNHKDSKEIPLQKLNIFNKTQPQKILKFAFMTSLLGVEYTLKLYLNKKSSSEVKKI